MMLRRFLPVSVGLSPLQPTHTHLRRSPGATVFFIFEAVEVGRGNEFAATCCLAITRWSYRPSLFAGKKCRQVFNVKRTCKFPPAAHPRW